jgi:hypothetical protein
MTRNEDGALAPCPNELEMKMRQSVTMHDDFYSKLRFKKSLLNVRQKDDALVPLVLPCVPGHKRIVYSIYEYEPLLDSRLV